MTTPMKPADRVKPADRGSAIDRGFQALQRWSIRIIAIALALYLLGWVIGKTWVVWFPICLAILVVSVLAPPAKWLRDRGLSAGISAGVVMAGFLGIIVGLFWVVIPQLINEAPTIARQAAAGIGEIQYWLINGPLHVGERQILAALDSAETWLKNSAVELGTGVVTTLATAVSALFNIVIILMLSFMLLKDGHRFLPFVEHAAGQRVGQHITGALSRVWKTLGGFIQTQGLVAFIDAVLIGIGLVIMDVSLAIPLAVLTFIGGFIPIIGAFITGALAVLVTLVTNSPQDALIVLLIVVGVQQLEGNVLSPMLQGKSMNLHPAVVLLAVAGGGSLFGITGAFLAVPAAASVAALLRYLDEYLERYESNSREESPGGSGDDTTSATSVEGAVQSLEGPQTP